MKKAAQLSLFLPQRNKKPVLFPYRDVSCIVTGWLFRELERKNIPFTIVMDKVEYPIDHLRNPYERIDWASFRQFMSNASQIWSHEQFVELGAQVLESTWAHPFTLIARSLYSVNDFYRWIAQPQTGPGNQVLGCFNFVFRELTPRHLQMEATIKEGYEPSPELFAMIHGALIAVPKSLKAGTPQVNAKPVNQGWCYDIWLPVKIGWFAQLRRTLALPFTAHSLAQGLQHAHEQLIQDYQALEKEVSERLLAETALKRSESILAGRNALLEILNELYAKLAVTLEIDLILQTVVRLITQLMDVTSVNLTEWDPVRKEIKVSAIYCSPQAVLTEWDDVGAIYRADEDFLANIATSFTQQSYILMHIDDPQLDPRDRRHLEKAGGKTLLELPLVAQGKCIGVLELWDSRTRRDFVDEEINLILVTVGQVAIAIENARLHAQMKTEIQERQRMQEALENSEARRRLGLHVAKVCTWEWDILNRIYWSDGMDNILKLPIKEGVDVRNTYNSFIYPDDVVKVNKALERAVKGDGVVQLEHRLLLPDGQIGWVLVQGKMLYDEEGNPLRLVGTISDITEQKKAHQALAESEARYRALLDAIPDVMYRVQLDGTFLEFKAKKGVVLNLDADQVVGRHLLELLPASVVDTTQRVLETALQTGELQTYEYELVVPAGKREFEGFCIASGQDEVVFIVRDVTERKQTEQVLRQTQKWESIGVLAGGVAHDFNNLLVGVLGQTSLALEKMPAGMEARSHVEKAIRAAENAAHLTRQLLAYAGKGKFEVSKVDINQLIQENLGLVKLTIPQTVMLEYALYFQPLYIQADAIQIQQVIMNLVLNAAEAGKKDHLLRVQLRTYPVELPDGVDHQWHSVTNQLVAGKYAAISVEDNGSGMSANTLSKIFDPFFTTKFTGRGLGLAAVLGIVQVHQGTIRVQTILGQGTTFQLLFPISSPQATNPISIGRELESQLYSRTLPH